MAYSKSSPYLTTPITNGNVLDVLTPRPFSASAGDQILTINSTYEYRPDL